MSTEIISDAEIHGYMNWRGPGAYTQHSLRRIKQIVAEVDRRIRARYVALDKELAEVYEMAMKQARTIKEKQAEIDRLMLEYCPEAMTPEQEIEWAANQKPVTEAWQGQSNINSPFNACQHKEYCCQLQQRVETATGEQQ